VAVAIGLDGYPPLVAVNRVRVGCSGWNYDDWRGLLYPQGVGKPRWLELYAERFDTVEVNSTFYRLASRQAVQRWVDSTPPGFLFSVKASRYLTHVRRLREVSEGVARFLDPLGPLVRAGRLGPYLWQLPPNFRRDDDLLAAALPALPPGRNAFEFRHPTWFAPEVMDLLRRHGVALVLAHHPERPWQTWELTADFAFVRFHYGARGRGGNYSATELDEWAGRVAGLAREAEVFAYFNNDWKGYAVRNATDLCKRLGAVCDPVDG
jgi:uncharacterized protein YecE (DUF72 family)